jgi:hypothetical protein
LQLYLQQNAEGVPALVVAQQLGPEPFREDKTWYLALADLRAGKTEAGLLNFETCSAARVTMASRACDEMKQLSEN